MEAAPTDAAALVDGATSSRAVIVGSIPPAGRDLDLLIEAGDRDAVAAELGRNDFERHGDSWVRFAGMTAYAVDLIPRDEWRLPDELFTEARPVEPYRNLARPAPAHALLVLARKLAGERGPLRDKHRRRIEDELIVDPRAWEAARDAAPAWGLAQELERLRSRARPGQAGRSSGVRGAVQLSRSRASTDPERAPRRERSPTRSSGSAGRPRPSGSRSARARRSSGSPGRQAGDRARPWRGLGDRRRRAPPLEPGGERGHRSPAMAAAATAWSTAGATANALAHLRAAAGPLATGKVVIFDRYVLDTVVHLRFTYGGVRHPAQERLVRLLSPVPVASFFLDVPPEVALSRKHDWDLPVLERQAELYRAEHAELGVRRLDGERPREELAAEIAREVWHRLR